MTATFIVRMREEVIRRYAETTIHSYIRAFRNSCNEAARSTRMVVPQFGKLLKLFIKPLMPGDQASFFADLDMDGMNRTPQSYQVRPGPNRS